MCDFTAAVDLTGRTVFPNVCRARLKLVPPVGLSDWQNIIRLVCSSTLEFCTSRWLQLSPYCKLNQNLVASLLEEYDQNIDNYLVMNYFSMVSMWAAVVAN
jgi:hypothetical protein